MRRPLAALFAGAVLCTAPRAALAQDPSPIEFLGFRPGSPRAEVEAQLAANGGSWRCTSSTDPRIVDCRGGMPSVHGALTLTASVIDDRLAILLLAGAVNPDGLAVWRERLQSTYGSVTRRTDHGQETWQWIRRRQMLRLTTRIEAGQRVVSVSLIDGPLLDGLNPPARRAP